MCRGFIHDAGRVHPLHVVEGMSPWPDYMSEWGAPNGNRRSVSPPNIIYSLANIHETEEILKHAYKYYFAQIPINMITDETPRIEAHDNMLKSILKENMSIVAKDELENNKIVGLVLSGLSTPQLMQESRDALVNVENEKCREIQTFLDKIHVGVDVFSILGTDKIFEFHTGSVDSDYTQQNIISELICRSLSLAKKLGFTAAMGIAVSAYSRRALEKQGFQPLATEVVADYVSPISGENIFANIDPVHGQTALVGIKL
jgi:N-acetylglutamate synthase-like GNAT family acetyltransferase